MKKQLKNYSVKMSKKYVDMSSTDINEKIIKYNSMDEDTLIEQLMNIVKQQKANGQYNSAQMQNFFTSISPELQPEQRQKLQNLIEAIENE